MMFRCAPVPFVTTQIGATTVAGRELDGAQIEIADGAAAEEATHHGLLVEEVLHVALRRPRRSGDRCDGRGRRRKHQDGGNDRRERTSTHVCPPVSVHERDRRYGAFVSSRLRPPYEFVNRCKTTDFTLT